MSTDEPKLTPESRRTLLEQSLQWFGSPEFNEDKNASAFSSFTKLILINQSFLNTSRNTSFDIYELYMDYSRILYDFDYLRFESKHIEYLRGVKLSFERDYKCIKLFQPPKFYLKFDDKIEEKDLNELIEILKATNGQISMEVTNTITPFHDIVRDFSSRICKFSCNGKFFTYCGMSLFGLLDELEVNEIRNAGQFLHISKCVANSLDLSFHEYLFDVPHSFELLMPRNNKHFLNKFVKQLRLYIEEFDYAMTQRIIEQVLKFFPSLVELKIDAVPCFNEHPKSQIPNVASNSYQYMRALKDRLFANGLKKIALKFNHRLYYEEKCNSKWINKTFSKTEFADWECKLKYRWPSNYYDLDHRDVILKLSTEEGINCKFGIKLDVTHEAGTSDEEEEDGDLIEHDDN